MTDGVVFAYTYTRGLRCLKDSHCCIIPFVRFTNANDVLSEGYNENIP